MSYMTKEEMRELYKLLTENNALEDSYQAWYKTRILNASASLSLEGNVVSELVQYFDKAFEAGRLKAK